MARTRKNLRGGQPVGIKRKAESPIEPQAAKKAKLECPTDDMKYHLKADMFHDHGSQNFDDPNMAILYGGNVENRTTDEAKVVEYMQKYYPASDSQFRLKNVINFTLNNKTDLFPQHGGSPWKPFVGVSNSKVAVVQDAGFVLYRAIESQNLITFGSILDQAGKPASKEDNPVYSKTTNSLTFPACSYGFNSDVVKDIHINNFTGKSVECKFNYKYGASWEPNGGTQGILQINKRKGDFMSIEEVAQTLIPKKRFAGYIGKALGDIMLVASLTPKIDNVENNLFPSDDLTALYGKDTDPKVTDIQHRLLNTGDRLNHVRAFMFGVDSVYSAPGVAGVRKFEYIPGIMTVQTDEAVREMYLNRIKLLIIQIDNAYNSLLQHLETEVIPGGFFDTRKSMKSGIQLVSNTSSERATNAIKYLIPVIETYRTYVLFYYHVFYQYYLTTQLESNDSLKTIYEILLNSAVELTPSATSTVGTRDIRAIVNIIKTSYLFYSIYSIEDTDIPIDYKKQKEISEGTEPSNTDTIIPKRTIDELTKAINPERKAYALHAYPVRSLWDGGVNGTHTFYISNVYQLIGKSQKMLIPFSYIFQSFKYGNLPDYPVEIIDGPTVGGQQNGDLEVFAQVFKRPNRVMDAPRVRPIERDVDIDILTDFLKDGRTPETLVKTYMTYQLYPDSILDKSLLEQVFVAYKNAIDGDFVLAEVSEERDPVSTKESLQFNSFACTYNSNIAASYCGVSKDLVPKEKNEYALIFLLREYASKFDEFATLAEEQVPIKKGAEAYLNVKESKVITNSVASNDMYDTFSQADTVMNFGSDFSRESSQERLSPLSSPYYNKNKNPRRQSFGIVLNSEDGQRVPNENLYIDWTKSFVRRGGSSPKSEVK